eukprot:UN08497
MKKASIFTRMQIYTRITITCAIWGLKASISFGCHSGTQDFQNSNLPDIQNWIG